MQWTSKGFVAQVVRNAHSSMTSRKEEEGVVTSDSQHPVQNLNGSLPISHQLSHMDELFRKRRSTHFYNCRKEQCLNDTNSNGWEPLQSRHQLSFRPLKDDRSPSLQRQVTGDKETAQMIPPNFRKREGTLCMNLRFMQKKRKVTGCQNLR